VAGWPITEGTDRYNRKKEKLVPDMLNGLVVVETTWKSSGIAV